MLLNADLVLAMNVETLKLHLELRGLSKSGNKPELRAHLLDAVAKNVPVRDPNDPFIYPNPEDGFSHTAHWVPLVPNDTPVDNPMRNGVHAPTGTAE